MAGPGGSAPDGVAGGRYTSWPLVISILLHAAVMIVLLFLRIPPHVPSAFGTPISITFLPDTPSPAEVTPAPAPPPVTSPKAAAAQPAHAQPARPRASPASAARMAQTSSRAVIPIVPFDPLAVGKTGEMTETTLAPPPAQPAPALPVPPSPAETPDLPAPALASPGVPAYAGNGLAPDNSASEASGQASGDGTGAQGANGTAYVQYIVMELNGLSTRQNEMSSIKAYTDKLMQCGMIAVPTSRVDWKVDVDVTFDANGTVTSIVPMYAPDNPSQDYRIASARLLMALGNPACNHLQLSPMEPRAIRNGHIYFYPAGNPTMPQGIPSGAAYLGQTGPLRDRR